MTQRTQRGQMVNRTNDEEVALYRFFDQGGRLLYIGIADEPLKRWSGHTKREWWPEVATYEVVWYGCREEAAEAERVAILAEEPIHNVVFNAIPYRWSRFPGDRLHALAWERFGDQPFSYNDLAERLGIPYGSAVAYGRRLATAGAFQEIGKRKGGPGRARLHFIATPPSDAE